MDNNKTTKLEKDDREIPNYASWWFIFTLDPKEDIEDLIVQRRCLQYLEGTCDTSNFVTAF